jgi:general transcription factor 3C polypeptide 3 (transcription factor C subunit 4)
LIADTPVACAVATKKYLIVVEQARKLIGVHQFNNEPLRILLASLASGMRPTDSFIVSTLQKHILREIKLGDMAVKNPDALKWNALNKRWVAAQGSTSAKGVEADDGMDDDIADENTNENPPPSGGLQDKDKANAPRAEMPTKSNPYIVAVYGQICIAAKSYQSAICTSCDALPFRLCGLQHGHDSLSAACL